MIIVVDSGSTKTHFVLLEKGIVKKESTLSGINPFYQNEDDIFNILKNEFTDIAQNNVCAVYHFGAGCSFPEKKQIVHNAWARLFANAEIFVDSDMLGAAKSVLGDNEGVACILGTGANSCLYDGEKIIQNIPPLGFILGDEGSGAYLGAKLVANCMKGICSPAIVDSFYQYFKCTPQQIMDGVYKQPLPSRYLASFVPFIAQNIENAEMATLVKSAFVSFFDRNVALYKSNTRNLGFVGGVANQFSGILQQVATEYGYGTIVVASDPMNGLVSYYRNRK